jgi:hypothetical protein
MSAGAATTSKDTQPGRGGAFRDNGIAIVFGVLFLLCLVGQAVAGWRDMDDQLRRAGLDTISFWHYVTTSDFAADVTENWQSEYLQFWLFAIATVWFSQKGSPESKELGHEGAESDEEQQVGASAQADSPGPVHRGGLALRVYSHSLGLVMGLIFLACWGAQSIAGWAAYNEQRLRDLMDPVSWGAYVASSDFWSRTLQNWQSELLAVGSFAVFAVYLRERGSSQSKPVGASHEATAVEG